MHLEVNRPSVSIRRIKTWIFFSKTQKFTGCDISGNVFLIQPFSYREGISNVIWCLRCSAELLKALLPSAMDKQPSSLWKGIMPSEHISLLAVLIRLSMHFLAECFLALFPARNAPQPSALSLVPCLCARGIEIFPQVLLRCLYYIKKKKQCRKIMCSRHMGCFCVMIF